MSRPDSSKAAKAGKHKLFCDLRVGTHLRKMGLSLNYFTLVQFRRTLPGVLKIVRRFACIGGEVTKLELVSYPFYVRFRSTSTNLRLFRDL